MARYRAALALILVLTLLPVATPVAAQDPDPVVRVCSNRTCSDTVYPINEWQIVGESCDSGTSVELFFVSSQAGIEYWVDVELAYTHDGASTASFFEGHVFNELEANANIYGQTQTLAVTGPDINLWANAAGDATDGVSLFSYSGDHPLTVNELVPTSAPIHVTVAVSNAHTTRSPSLRLADNATASVAWYNSCSLVAMRYTDVRFEAEPPEPPTAYCPPGSASVLGADTVFDLDAGATWSDAVQVVVPQFTSHWYFEPASSPAAPSYDLELTLNDITLDTTVNVSDTIWYGDAFRVTVPITGGVPGPDAVLAAQNTSATGADLVLADVCLVAYQGSDLCPDGIEMLAAPVTLHDNSGEWYGESVIPWTKYVLQVTLGNPNFLPGPIGMTGHVAEIQVMFNADGFDIGRITTVWSRLTIPAGEMETVTLPPSPGIIENHNPATAVGIQIDNLAWRMNLESACLMDAETFYQETFLTAENCMLDNPDFAYPFTTADWDTSGDVTQVGDDTAWAEFGLQGRLSQVPNLSHRQVYRMETRARSVSGGGIGGYDFGTERTSLADGGPQIETVSTLADWGVYENLVYLTPEDAVFVDASSVDLDYVCLFDSYTTPFDGFLDDIANMDMCALPGPRPDNVLDTIAWVGSVILAGLCQLLVFILKILNGIYTLVHDILLSIPALPGHGGEFTWPIWIREAITGIGTTIGIYLTRIWEFVQPLVGLIVAWIQRTVANILAWFAAQFGLDVAALLATIRLIGIEFEAFFRAMGAEIQREAAAALVLLLQTVDLLLVLSNGVRSGVTGNSTAFTSAEIEAAAPFIWAGFQFVNTIAANTPIAALNILALAIASFGLLMWTGRKFQSIVALITPGNSSAGSTA